MNIAIYKPYKPILEKDEKGEDDSGWSIEIVNFIKILREYTDATIHILSRTDMKKYVPTTQEKHYDILFVYNGKFFDQDYEFVNKFKDTFKVLCVTDLGLVPDDYHLGLFNLVLSQSVSSTATRHEIERYYPFQSLVCYQAKQNTKEKVNDYMFAGSERSRLAKFIEYVWRPDCVLYGKSQSLGFNQKVPFKQIQLALAQSRFSVVFVDIDYERKNFLTQRYYECLVNDVIAFIDVDYDRLGVVVTKSDWLRVQSYQEMKHKMQTLKNNESLMSGMIEQQRRIVALYRDGRQHFEMLRDVIKTESGLEV